MPPFSFLKNFKETRSERSNFAMPCSPEELGKGENTSGGNIGVTMRTINTIALLAFFAVGVFAQTEVIPFKYEQAEPFSDGLAAVKLGGKWGFIDKEGNEVIPPKLSYEWVGGFSENMARVANKQYKSGFINRAGKEIVPPKYVNANDFKEGMASVELGGKMGFINNTGKLVVPTKYDNANTSWGVGLTNFSDGLAIVDINYAKGQVGLIDKTGKVITSIMEGGMTAERLFNISKLAKFLSEGGITPVCANKKCNYVDKTGKVKIPATKYQRAEPFYEGLAEVCVENKAGEKCSFIDTTGKEIVPIKYESMSYFKEGLAVVSLGGKNGFVDNTGKEVIPLKFGLANSFSEGLAAVLFGEYGTGKWGFIDKTGKEVIPPKFGFANSFSEGLALVVLDGKFVFIDNTGKEVIPTKYGSVNGFSEGLAAVRLGDHVTGKWGFIDKTGKEVVPPKYNSVNNLSQGVAKVELDKKFGFIDKTGKEIVPPKYASISEFNEVMAVQVDGKMGFIDKTGKEIVPLGKYNVLPAAFQFVEGIAQISSGDKWGLIDKTGKEIAPLGKYNVIGINVSNVNPFSEGMVNVCAGAGKCGFIDKTGKEVIPLKYDAAGKFSEGLAMVCSGGKCGYISASAAGAGAPAPAPATGEAAKTDAKAAAKAAAKNK